MLTFHGGWLTADTDAYGNVNTAKYLFNPTSLTQWDNSGGRDLYLTGGEQLTKVASPLAFGSLGGTKGQTVAYSFGTTLASITRGYGTGDAATASFGFTGKLLTGVTTPMNQTWSISYDGSNRVSSITSPISGTVGQPGYTPAYTTQFVYNAGSTMVTEGYGTQNPIVTTYTLDSVGRTTAIADGLGDTQYFSYDQDNDIQSYTDGNGHVTTNHYQYVGTGGSYGLLTETDSPAIHPNYPTNTLTAPVTHYVYNATTNDLVEHYDNYGAYTFYSYDGHHSPTSMAQLTGSTTSGGTTYYHWRGQLWQYDGYGELTGVVDGRGVGVPDTTSLATAPTVGANGQAASYTHSFSYAPAGDLASSATPPITTSACPTSTCAATTTYGDDTDGDLTAVQSADGQTYTYGYDHLGRRNSAKLPPLTLANPPSGGPTTGVPLTTLEFDGDGNVSMAVTASGADLYYSYDPLGRLVSTQQPLSLRTQSDPKAVAQTALTINSYSCRIRDKSGSQALLMVGLAAVV